MLLFDQCYKMGIEDAIDINDDIACNDFVARMYAPMKFGRIVHSYEVDWREWKFMLTQLVHRNVRFRQMGIKYFDGIVSYGNYLTCALPIAMDFYLQGIKDYVKFPRKGNFIRFRDKCFMRWGDKLRKATMDDFVRDVTQFCYERTHLESEAYEAMMSKDKRERYKGVRGLSRAAFMSFQSDIWKYTRVKVYKTRVKRAK